MRVSTLCIFVGDISGCFHSHAPVLVLRFSQLFLQLHAQLQLATSPCVPHLGVFRVMLVPLFVTSTSLLLGPEASITSVMRPQRCQLQFFTSISPRSLQGCVQSPIPALALCYLFLGLRCDAVDDVSPAGATLFAHSSLSWVFSHQQVSFGFLSSTSMALGMCPNPGLALCRSHFPVMALELGLR